MPKILRYTFIVLAFVSVVIAIAAFVFWRALPSLGEIAKHLNQPTSSEMPAGTSAPANPEYPSLDKAESAKPGGKPISINPRSYGVMKMIEQLTDEEKPLASFCNSLSQVTQGTFEVDQASLNSRIERVLLGGAQDPLVESFSPALRFAFTRPKFKAMMNEVHSYIQTGQGSDSSKLAFYQKVLAAYHEARDNLHKTEEIMDRGYHLMLLAKTLSLKPQLLKDKRVDEYCHAIEKAINEDIPSNFAEEREAFNDFIRYAGITPEQIDYDPEYQTELTAKLTDGKLMFEGGWVDDMLGK